MVRTIFDQPDSASVRDQYARVLEAIDGRFRDAATHLDDARADLLAFRCSHTGSGATITVNVADATPSESQLCVNLSDRPNVERAHRRTRPVRRQKGQA